MWKKAVICILSSLWYACGSFENDMAKTIQMCCSTGTEYATTHNLEECSQPLPVPQGVPASFGAVCSIARTQCCEAYFMKEACNNGIDLATSTERCDPVQGTGKMCCDNCKRGQAAGQNGDMDACTLKSGGNSPEELLAADAHKQCCEKSAKESHTDRTSLWGHPDSSASTKKPESVLPSVCEDYAPTELCAHHCIPVPGSYKCECNPGFMLMADGRNCREVVKNRCKPRNPCHHKCNDNGVGIKCSCRRGFELMADRKSCKDIDECALDMQICLPGTQCVNVRGSYKCIPVKKNNVEKGQCPPGFARNLANSACDDINECELPHPPCPTYLCENTIGAYKCGGVSGDPRNLAPSNAPHHPAEDRCPPGFQLGDDNECQDMDECAEQNDDCNHLSQFCINTHSSFYCQDKGSKHCPPGFKINPESNKCEDIDECEDNGEICRVDQVCVNQLGQYDCKLKHSQRAHQVCPDGMRIKHGKLYCEDIDECVEGTHLCDQYQNCLNTNGSYECHCKLGYELDAMTGACVDMNECASGHHDCNSETQRCDNTVGSYLCIRMTSCGTGYILHHSTGKCEDSDECALGTHNCARAGPEYQCVNIPGSFRCVRKRTSTTSTTLAPEYEYEYYDSEEDTAEGNQTASDAKPAEPTTTTTLKPETTSETPQTTSSTTEELPRRPDDDNNIVPLDENEQKLPEITFKQPEEPILLVPLQPGDSKPTSYEPEIKPTEQPATHYEPVQPEEPKYSPPTEEPPRPSSSEPNPPDANESIEPQPETTISPIPEQTESSNHDPPQVVLVNVGQDTAKIDGERGNDGSVIVNTQDVPKHKWTKINKKPFSSVNCPPGFEIDEHGGCFDIDECATNRHRCSGLTELCRNTIGGYLCICAPGFRRDLYTGACDLIITSSSTSSTTYSTTPSTTPSTTTSTTTSTTPSTTTSTTSTTTPAPVPSTTEQSSFYGYPVYRITTRPFHSRNLCDFGFRLNIDTGVCEDIDECTDGKTNCAQVEICVNTPGGYRCDCPPNWSLDEEQHRCLPIRSDEQFPPGYGNTPVQSQGNQRDIFRETNTSFITPDLRHVDDRGSGLRCGDGYYLTEYNTCEDIDECMNGQARCGQLQVCTNLPGGYVCGCPPGHRQLGDHECEDIDECALAGDRSLCSLNADCVNTIGSYQCQCHLGFRPAPVNDKVCVDVDECMESRAGSLCQQRCNNVWGGYRCSCHRGYRLNFDNSTCFDIDECEEFKSKIPCVGRCHNEPGSYRCSCPSGYKLSEDKRSCIDIDECENGEATCAGGAAGSTSDVCFNTRGGYRCNRITCPPGYHLEGKHRCSRIERNCRVGDWDCAHQPSTISFNYITFVSNLYIPDTKVKLFTMRGPTWQNAKMKFELRLIDVNAPPSVKNKAGVHYFNLTQINNEAVVSLVHPLEGPQSIELQLIMELFYAEQFGGIAIAKLFIFVSEYEF